MKYIKVYTFLLNSDIELSTAEKMLLSIILSQYEFKGFCDWSNKRFADCLGFSAAYISRMVNHLKVENFIKEINKKYIRRALAPTTEFLNLEVYKEARSFKKRKVE